MDVALVDLEYPELDAFRAVLAERLEAAGQDPGEALRARVRLVLADSPAAPSLAWAGLAGVPCAGESGRLGEVVVDQLVVSAHSARKDAVARLAAALGVHVLVLAAAPSASAPASATASSTAREARP